MARPLRVYGDPQHYNDTARAALNDILKAHWNSASPAQRRITYGNRPDLFEVVTEPEAADLHLLTMRWQHYVENGRVDLARQAVEVARGCRRPIAVFSLGDFEANFPIAGDDIHLFQVSAYRSRQRTRNHAIPAFIDDPLLGFGDGKIPLRDKTERASVGFCGQAGASLARHTIRLLRNQARQVSWRLGREKWEPAPLEHTWFRQRILDAFTRSRLVDTKFVLRTKYRAGVAHAKNRNDPTERARLEFLNNMSDADYAICVRGSGNFSVRFYEALAMGRVPVFVDTDCVLPYREQIDWRRYTIWVDDRDALDAPALVASQHARLPPQAFVSRQLECRRLWEERLTPDGFYAHFHEHFPELQR